MEPVNRYQPINEPPQLKDLGIDPNGKIVNINRQNTEYADQNPGLSCTINALFCALFPILGCCACTQVRLMHDKIVSRFGTVRYVLREPGCYCINPLSTTTFDVFVGLNDVEIFDLKLNDLNRNPLLVSAQFVYRISESVYASYKTRELSKFLKDQGETALRAVLAEYPYDVDSHHTECLGRHSQKIDDHLKNWLQAMVAPIGIKIERFSLFSVGIQEKMEKLLLARQEAHAEVIARTTIAEGSAGILEEILKHFKVLGINLSETQRNNLATNLTLLLVNHGHTTLNIFESNAPSQMQLPQQLPPPAAAKT